MCAEVKLCKLTTRDTRIPLFSNSYVTAHAEVQQEHRIMDSIGDMLHLGSAPRTVAALLPSFRFETNSAQMFFLISADDDRRGGSTI